MRIRVLAGSLGKLIFQIAMLLAGAFLGFQVALRVACHRRPMAMPTLFSSFLEHPLRMAYRNPREFLTHFGIAEGEAVLDLGCGKGTFTIEAARLVGETGVVHAIDAQSTIISQIEQRFNRLGLVKQTRFHVSTAQKIPLANSSLDVVLLVSTLGEVADPLLAIDEIYRILKPSGRLVISEELLDPGYVSSQTVRRWMEDAGFELNGKRGNPFCYAHLYLPRPDAH